MRFVERKYDAGHWRRLYIQMSDDGSEVEDQKNHAMNAWCVDQFGPGGDHCRWNYETTGVFLFHDLSLAVAFKLRWMTSSYEQR